MPSGGMCDCHKIRKQITFSIDFDAPITVALVVVCTVVLLGDAVTNTQHCTLAQDTGYYALATAKSSGPQPEPEWMGGYVEAVAPQDSFEPWDGGQPKLQPESESEPEPEPEPPQSKFVAAQSALEDHIGCGLNAWMFTCYTHDYYDSFSAAFIPRIFTWCDDSPSAFFHAPTTIFCVVRSRMRLSLLPPLSIPRARATAGASAQSASMSTRST